METDSPKASARLVASFYTERLASLVSPDVVIALVLCKCNLKHVKQEEVDIEFTEDLHAPL